MQVMLFPELLRLRAVSQPDHCAYAFYQGGQPEADTLSYKELFEQAASLASQLQAAGLAQQTVLLACLGPRHFIVAFYACLLAGSIAVPTAPPRRQVLHERLRLLAEDAAPQAMLADTDALLEAAGPALQRFDLRCHTARTDHAALAGAWQRPALDGDALAFLQYTSGSTGAPKGVAVSHANLAANCAAIIAAMGIGADSAILTALPLFHDMGLIGGVLVDMVAGCRASFLPPAEFVQYPERWLQLISSARITHSGGPNFMYELCARHADPQQLAGVDLSTWQVAFCGAEPVRAATVSRFVERFSAIGFRPASFYPCYGMAESTLFISGPAPGSPVSVLAHAQTSVVGCGQAAPGTSLLIADPASGQALADGEVGEIWVAGPSVAQGYWQRPQLNAHTFRAGPGQAYLRTGDLGFLRDGTLYVTGRLKDLIIVYGKKYAAHDLEEAAERSHPALSIGGGAAFGAERDGQEQVVLVFELRREWLRQHQHWPDVRSQMRTALRQSHGLQVDDILFLRPGSLPRTSSGKVRRADCRAGYLAGLLPVLSAAEQLPA